MRQQHAVRPQGHTPELDRPDLPKGRSGPFSLRSLRLPVLPRAVRARLRGLPCMLAVTSS
ncbi:hypothetical protein CO2235_MP40059 [Cupriavidus oxalaticus]|uniref:Uncharacterized protein n=1 Tax=Cupriavidus oxalaticus TaxID=96344 RepID=A0A375GL26_9BURK|nr:hypothetical protein CO2235_MP40059 [Cupriavidus oxalaticus]